MILKSLLIISICTTFLLSANAQFSDSTPHYLRFDITGILNKTNDVRSYVLNTGLNFTIKKKRFSLNNSNNWVYGRSGNNLSNNDFFTGLNLDYLKDVQKLYYWALATFTTSYSLKINYQFQAGGGIGYNFINRENLELVVSDGLLYEAGSREPVALQKDVYQTVRNSLRIKHRFNINGVISLNGTHFWQPSLEAFDDYIIRSITTCNIKLRKWLSISAGLTYNKISRTNRENLLVNIGLSAEKYF